MKLIWCFRRCACVYGLMGVCLLLVLGQMALIRCPQNSLLVIQVIAQGDNVLGEQTDELFPVIIACTDYPEFLCVFYLNFVWASSWPMLIHSQIEGAPWKIDTLTRSSIKEIISWDWIYNRPGATSCHRIEQRLLSKYWPQSHWGWSAMLSPSPPHTHTPIAPHKCHSFDNAFASAVAFSCLPTNFAGGLCRYIR